MFIRRQSKSRLAEFTVEQDWAFKQPSEPFFKIAHQRIESLLGGTSTLTSNQYRDIDTTRQQARQKMSSNEPSSSSQKDKWTIRLF
jgi:hypothetical protein